MQPICRVDCKYCSKFFSITVIRRHETYCSGRIETLSSKFIEKQLEESFGAPPLRVASLAVNRKVYPILIEDVLSLVRKKYVKRLCEYRGKQGVSIHCFAFDDNSGGFSEAWNAVLKARKAGAKL